MSRTIWNLFRPLNRGVIKLVHAGLGPARFVLLLTTTGRKSSLPRQTPLQYGRIDNAYAVGSARGSQADWFRNLQAHSQVEVLVKGQRFSATAEAITDPRRVADFLEQRMRDHPVMMRFMLLLHGVPPWADRRALEHLGARLALAILHTNPPSTMI